MSGKNKTSIGGYLAKRLEEIGVKHYFTVPGDYNLILLDEFLKNKNLEMISCCNELNAGYAADGYARAKGIGVVVTTFSVGALSALNAVAGSYSEDLPVIIISGGPNTNSEPENQTLHHTLGKVHYQYQRDIFSHVCSEAVVVKHKKVAPYQIDVAIKECLRTRKPVYIEIPCNIAGLDINKPRQFRFFDEPTSDPAALKQAVEHAADFLNSVQKPILVAGVKLRPWNAIESFKKFADSSDYAVASMPNAKGFFPEDHKNYLGTYWGQVSSPGVSEILESSHAYLFAGPTFTDYTTTGYTTLINQEKLINVGPDYVKLPDGTYNHVYINEFLKSLAKKIKPNNTNVKAFNRIKTEPAKEHPVKTKEVLTTRRMFAIIQSFINSKTAVIAETGDSWFNGLKLDLPGGSKFEIQMQYGSIGWSVGATLGHSLGMPEKRVMAFIGDGSFQLTAQEISTMIRYKLNPIIFLINNGGYTIEVEIHDGPYNNIKNWKYSELVDVFNAEDGNGISFKVETEGELQDAIKKSLKHKGLCFIEVASDRDDCSKELLEWGSKVAANNARAPKELEI